jgi:hypothetical protein
VKIQAAFSAPVTSPTKLQQQKEQQQQQQQQQQQLLQHINFNQHIKIHLLQISIVHLVISAGATVSSKRRSQSRC